MKRAYILMTLMVLLATAGWATEEEQSETTLLPTEEQVVEATAEPEEERITFNVKLSEERGGGRVTGSAGDLELQEGQYLLASGGVELKYRDLILQADLARVDIPTNLLTAEGNVILDEGPQRLTGDTLQYDLSTQTGKVTQATAYVDPDYYFSGSQIAKIGEQTFTVNDGVFTSCEQDVPSWSIHLRDANITLEEYARIKHARLKFKRLPVLYMPYVLWPATTERTSGFLVPKPGYSNRRGASLDLAYYKTLGRTADTTFFADVSSGGYFGFGNEVRYRPSERTEGYLKAYVSMEPDEAFLERRNLSFAAFSGLTNEEIEQMVNNLDPDLGIGDTRWKFEYFHETKELWGKFRGVVDFQEYSDLEYPQDFERQVGRQTRSFIYSKAYLTSNFGPHSLNIFADRRERIQRARDIRLQMPEVEYRLRSFQLGKAPLYLNLDSSLHYFSVDVENTQLNVDDQYGRVHFAPTLTAPLSPFTWLSATVKIGGRATYYSDSLAPRLRNEEDNTPLPRELSGDAVERILPTGSVELVGPVFSKIFDRGAGRFAKFKHVIEPRVTYSFIDDFDDTPDDEDIDLGIFKEFDDKNDPFSFDEVDNLNPTDSFVFSLVNRLVAKPRNEKEGGSSEIASFELRQAFSRDDTVLQQGIIAGSEEEGTEDVLQTSRKGPLLALLRVNPSQRTSFKADFRYSTLFSKLASTSFSGEKWFGQAGKSRLGRHKLGFTWFRTVNPVTDVKTSDQVRLFAGLELIRDRLNFDAVVSFDADEGEILQQRYFIDWSSQCYNWRLEVRESKFGTGQNLDDQLDVRFALSLKNVGTFLDLNESF